MVSRFPKLSIHITIVVGLSLVLGWILWPNIAADYFYPCSQKFILLVGSVRDVEGRYPARLNDLKSYLEMATNTSCSIQTIGEDDYYVEWQQSSGEMCRLMVVYRLDTTGNLEEFNVHRINQKPD